MSEIKITNPVGGLNYPAKDVGGVKYLSVMSGTATVDGGATLDRIEVQICGASGVSGTSKVATATAMSSSGGVYFYAWQANLVPLGATAPPPGAPNRAKAALYLGSGTQIPAADVDFTATNASPPPPST